MKALRVAIVGYGIGGIAAAIHLRRLGHRITHFERIRPAPATGSGLLLHPGAQRQLQKLGVFRQAMDRGAPVRRIRAQSTHGRPLLDCAYPRRRDEQFGLGIQRGTLHGLLAEADEGSADVQVVTLSGIDACHGLISDTEGRQHGPYDLVVVADGSNSRLRTQLGLHAGYKRPAETAALVGLLDDRNEWSGDCLTQYFDGGRHLSIWPVGNDGHGAIRRCCIAMNVAVTEAQHVGERWLEYMTHKVPGLTAVLPSSGGRPELYLYRYRDIELGRYAAGRAVLIGDAAHSMSPQLGVGAQLAMEDAAVLAAALAENASIASALRQYDTLRPAQVSRYHRVSRLLTPLFQSNNRIMAAARDRLLSAAAHSPVVQRLSADVLG